MDISDWIAFYLESSDWISDNIIELSDHRDYFTEDNIYRNNHFLSFLWPAFTAISDYFVQGNTVIALNYFTGGKGKLDTLVKYFDDAELEYQSKARSERFDREISSLQRDLERIADKRKFSDNPLITNEVISLFHFNGTEGFKKLVEKSKIWFGFVATKCKDVNKLKGLFNFKISQEDTSEKNVKGLFQFLNKSFGRVFEFISVYYLKLTNTH